MKSEKVKKFSYLAWSSYSNPRPRQPTLAVVIYDEGWHPAALLLRFPRPRLQTALECLNVGECCPLQHGRRAPGQSAVGAQQHERRVGCVRRAHLQTDEGVDGGAGVAGGSGGAEVQRRRGAEVHPPPRRSLPSASGIRAPTWCVAGCVAGCVVWRVVWRVAGRVAGRVARRAAWQCIRRVHTSSVYYYTGMLVSMRAVHVHIVCAHVYAGMLVEPSTWPSNLYSPGQGRLG